MKSIAITRQGDLGSRKDPIAEVSFLLVCLVALHFSHGRPEVFLRRFEVGLPKAAVTRRNIGVTFVQHGLDEIGWNYDTPFGFSVFLRVYHQQIVCYLVFIRVELILLDLLG